MLIVEETGWPLAIVRWQAPVFGCDLEMFRSRFEYWLTSADVFAVVSVTAIPLQVPACSLRQMGHWLHLRRDLIAGSCAGLASVFPATLLSETWTCSYSSAASARLGCAAAAFPEEGPAVQWALERLREAARSRRDASLWMEPCLT